MRSIVPVTAAPPEAIAPWIAPIYPGGISKFPPGGTGVAGLAAAAGAAPNKTQIVLFELFTPNPLSLAGFAACTVNEPTAAAKELTEPLSDTAGGVEDVKLMTGDP